MTARSRTRNSVSMPSFYATCGMRHATCDMPHATCGMWHAASLARPIAEVPPMQLLAQPLEEALRAEPDEQHGAFGAAHFQAFARMDRDADLPVERHQHFVAPGRSEEHTSELQL